MSLHIEPITSELVRQVAALIRTFNQEQIRQLLNLVPELDVDDTFIAGLTYNQFFALPDAEKNRIWKETIKRNKRNHDPVQFQRLFDALSDDIQATHPFATMSKEDILKSLQKTRDELWTERHGYQH